MNSVRKCAIVGVAALTAGTGAYLTMPAGRALTEQEKMTYWGLVETDTPLRFSCSVCVEGGIGSSSCYGLDYKPLRLRNEDGEELIPVDFEYVHCAPGKGKGASNPPSGKADALVWSEKYVCFGTPCTCIRDGDGRLDWKHGDPEPNKEKCGVMSSCSLTDHRKEDAPCPVTKE